MHGEFMGVWSASWRDIWSRLAKTPGAPLDLFCELYREIVQLLSHRPEEALLADRFNDPAKARRAFRRIKAADLPGEREVIQFLEVAFTVIKEIEDDSRMVSTKYFDLLSNFLAKFNLRYELCRPCILCPTLPGLFTSLIGDLQTATAKDANLRILMEGFEEALRDLRHSLSEHRIRTCISKQVMLLEALGAACPGVTKRTLGEICDQLESWPHTAIKESLKKVYGFASDYSGIRHGTSNNGAKRPIDMRDLVAISILLAGFTPYMTDQLDPDVVYRRV